MSGVRRSPRHKAGDRVRSPACEQHDPLPLLLAEVAERNSRVKGPPIELLGQFEFPPGVGSCRSRPAGPLMPVRHKAAVWLVWDWSLTTRRARQTQHPAPAINARTNRDARSDRDTVMALDVKSTVARRRPHRYPASVLEALHRDDRIGPAECESIADGGPDRTLPSASTSWSRKRPRPSPTPWSPAQAAKPSSRSMPRT